jgi:hypothetical protein
MVNIRINGLSWILRMMQQRALKHLSVMILRRTRNLWPSTHRRRKSEPCTIQPLSGAPEIPGHMPYVMSLVSIDHALQICQSNLPTLYVMELLNSCVSIWDTDMADPGQRCSVCCHLIQVQVHRRIIGICIESRYDRSSTAYVPIKFGKETV